MFDTIARGFRQARNRLAGLTELTEQNIDAALREVRISYAHAVLATGRSSRRPLAPSSRPRPSVLGTFTRRPARPLA